MLKTIRLFIVLIGFMIFSLATFNGHASAEDPPAPPQLTVNTGDNLVVIDDRITISGTALNADRVMVNNKRTNVSSRTGSFSCTLTLDNIRNVINVTAYKGDVASETKTRTVYYSFQPTIEITNHEQGMKVTSPDIILAGEVTPKNQSDIESFTVDGEDTPVYNGEFNSSPIILKPGKNDIKLTMKTKEYSLPDGRTVPAREVTEVFKIEYLEGPDIDIYEPDDEEIIYSNQVTVKGRIQEAEGITEIKIGNEETDVDEDGYFEQDITLKSGENEIKITVSDGSTNVTETITVYSNILAVNGSEMIFEVKDGQEIKAFNDGLKIKLAKGSVGSNTKAIIEVDNSYLAKSPPQTAIISPVFHIDWEGDEPIKPYKVSVKYDEVVKENQAPKVTFMFYDDRYAEWKTIGGVVDPRSYSVSAEFNKTGYVAAALSYITFGDINGHWARRDIEFLAAKGAIAGQNGGQYFRPDASITRAEFVTCLVKAMGLLPYKPIEASYFDVPPTHWSYEYVEAASRAGIVSGISYGSFAPNRTITREEAAAILTRAANLKLAGVQEINSILGNFKDSDRISPWARVEVATAVKAKIINGNEMKQFLPKRTTTRAQAASMIARLVENLSKTKGK